MNSEKDYNDIAPKLSAWHPPEDEEPDLMTDEMGGLGQIKQKHKNPILFELY